MKLKEITIQKVFNTTNYESLKIGFTAEIEDTDDLKEVKEAIHKEIFNTFCSSPDILAKLKAEVVWNNKKYFDDNQIKWAKEYLKIKDDKTT